MISPISWIRGLVGAGPRPGIPILPPETDRSPAVLDRFLTLAGTLRASPMLEAGTLQSVPGRPTHHQRSFPWIERADYVMMDVQGGHDVDVVADLHALPEEWTGRFGVFLAMAVFEHLERPWIAAREVARVLKPGGVFMVGTHQTFPLHGFPQDFFRFSKEALSLIFADAGLEMIEASYRSRCKLVPPPEIVPPPFVEQWNDLYPSYVLVNAMGRKPS